METTNSSNQPVSKKDGGKLRNLIVRALTGVAFVAVMVYGILHSPATFGLLFTIITCLSVWEFTGIVNQRPDVNVNRFITTVAGGCLFVGFYGYAAGIAGAGVLFVPWLLSMIYMLVSELYLQRESPLNDWAYSMMAQIYVALPFALLCLLDFAGVGTAGSTPLALSEQPDAVIQGSWLVLAVYVFLWLNDTGAYCVGSLLGRHKLFPRVSPGKSWEGSIGGAVVCLAVAMVAARYLPALTTLEWAGFALIVVVFGTWGDLVESLLKRQMGIKDSGHILPGHGGMLDRFDSSLLAIPAVVIYLFTLTTL
ncbi:MAG: phosphatidate cytidylyltransferase [Bacteroidaceae bacterium]|nr:phosphatidate cytidylyltransferase [Bacteroidaceae bacterium]